MADPLSTAASALTVVHGATKVCESSYTQIKSIRSAPTHITRLAYELQSTSTVLHTLNRLLLIGNEKTSQSTWLPKQRLVGLIFDLVFYTRRALDDIFAVVEPFTRDQRGGKKGVQRLSSVRAMMLEFLRKNEVVALIRTLDSYKMTLGLACSSLQV